MAETLRYPKTWSLTLLERELSDAAASPPLSMARMRALRWLAELEPDEAEILWGRACGLSWAALTAERDGVNEQTIAHRFYMPALQHLKTIATLDTFERTVAAHTGALRETGKRLDRHFDKVEAQTHRLGKAA